MEEIGLRKQPFVGFCAKGKKKQRHPLINLSVSLFSLCYRLQLRLGVVP